MTDIKLKSPVTVNFTITEKCNQRCNFCFVDSDSSKKNAPTSTIKEVLDECADADVFNVKLFGGEPFMHPDIEETVKYAYDNNFDIRFTSNGQLISENNIGPISNYITAGAISIHGFENTHDKITGKKKSYKRALSAVNILNDFNIPTGILYTLTKENKDELYPFGSYILNNFDIGYFGVDRFVPLGRGTEELSPSIKDYNKAFSELLRLKKEHPKAIVELGDAFPFCLLENEEYKEVVRGGCSAGFSFCEINGDGDIKICPAQSKPIGNILELSLEEIWQNNKDINEYRDLKVHIHPYCKECQEFEECGGGCRASSISGEHLLNSYQPFFNEKKYILDSQRTSTQEELPKREGRPKLSKGVRMREDLEGYLVYFNDRLYLTSEIGYNILSLCDGKRNKDEINQILKEKYNIEIESSVIDNFLKKSPMIKYE